MKSTFRYPEGSTLRAQRLKIAELERDYGAIGRYRLVIEDLIFDDDKHVEIRFGYYRQRPGDQQWRWASQTTFCFPVDDTIELLAQACRKEPEWRKRIEAVLARATSAEERRE